MLRVAVGSEYSDLVSAALQSYGRINDETFCASYPKVWMHKHNVLVVILRIH